MVLRFVAIASLIVLLTTAIVALLYVLGAEPVLPPQPTPIQGATLDGEPVTLV